MYINRNRLLLIFLTLLISCNFCISGETDINLYIDNKACKGDIFLYEEKCPLISAEILASRLEIDWHYEAFSGILFFEDKIFTGKKIMKYDTLFVSIEDFADLFDFDYYYDEKVKTIDLRTFPVRLKEISDTENLSLEENPLSEKTGKELKILYERSESTEDNKFVLYATVQNISGLILDRVIVRCTFYIPNNVIIEEQSLYLNSLFPGDYREISFSVEKPSAGGTGETSLSRTNVITPDGGVYSSVGLTGGVIAPVQLITPDYKIETDYEVREEE